MENQHRKISGYRELSQTEIDLMNDIKAFGPQLEALCRRIQSHVSDQHRFANVGPDEAENRAEIVRLIDAEPEKWLAMGRADLQTGLMRLTRSIAQPGFF